MRTATDNECASNTPYIHGRSEVLGSFRRSRYELAGSLAISGLEAQEGSGPFIYSNETASKGRSAGYPQRHMRAYFCAGARDEWETCARDFQVCSPLWVVYYCRAALEHGQRLSEVT